MKISSVNVSIGFSLSAMAFPLLAQADVSSRVSIHFYHDPAACTYEVDAKLALVVDDSDAYDTGYEAIIYLKLCEFCPTIDSDGESLLTEAGHDLGNNQWGIRAKAEADNYTPYERYCAISHDLYAVADEHGPPPGLDDIYLSDKACAIGPGSGPPN